MRRAILRSFAVAALTLAIGGLGEIGYAGWLCPAHHVWQRVHAGQTDVILDSGYRYARPDEAIYACTIPHRLGLVVLHQDLNCYCAPADLGASALGRTLGGSCSVDHLHAARGDESGACRHAHCTEPVPPGLFTP